MSEIEYDSHGRMKYNPEFHFNHGTKMTEEETEYLCKFHEIDGMDNISLALGRTRSSLAEKLSKVKKQGKYEYYRSLNNYI